MQDLSGTQIDRYSIHEEIGRGGMSRVYRAHQPGLERDVALKVLLPEITGDEVSVARFLREARAAAQLDHPNIVPIYDTGQDDGSYFIAMRLIEGRTLRQVLGERELSLAEIGGYLSQIASALDYAHERGIVHRDIKPENIMVDARGSITLTDFGIANLADEMSVTTTGAVIGTPVYMAPEQLRGEIATPRSDIYALGVLAYELVSGSTPFAGRAPYAVMLAQIDEQPQPVHERRRDVPPAASRAIDGALEKDPALRYGTAGAFASQFMDTLGEEQTVRPAGPVMPGQRLRGTGAVTIQSTISPLASSRVPSTATRVAGISTPVSIAPPWRGPRLMSLLGIGLLLVVMIAGVSAFRDGRDSSAQDNNPALLPADRTSTPGSTAENTPEPDSDVPVAAEPSPTTEAQVEVVEEPSPTTVPSPTTEPPATETPVEVVDDPPTEVPAPAEVVVEPPPATETPVEVVEEPPPVDAVPTEADDESPTGDDADDDDQNPENGPGNKPEKPEKEKPDTSNTGNDEKKNEDKDDRKEKEDEDEDDEED